MTLVAGDVQVEEVPESPGDGHIVTDESLDSKCVTTTTNPQEKHKQPRKEMGKEFEQCCTEKEMQLLTMKKCSFHW